MCLSFIFIFTKFAQKVYILTFDDKNSEIESFRGENMEEKEKVVMEAMKKAGKPLRPGDIAKMTGLESKEVSKIIAELKKKGKVIVPKRCYYAPAEK